MSDPQWKARKVVIIGAGAVGATFAYSLAQSGIADEICLVDVNEELVKGQVLDLSHGLPYYPPVQIYEGDKEDYRDAHVIVMTAGASQRPGETRIDLLQKNAQIVERVMEDIMAQNSPAIVLMVTNPVDVLTLVALKKSGWPRNRIFGSGTVLDSARFRYLISHHFKLDVHNVHGYILGEHGDSEFAAWSMTNIGGLPIHEYCLKETSAEEWAINQQEIERAVRHSAYHIIDYKGATNFAVGLALVRIIRPILKNQRSVLTVSTRLDGEYGLHDVCLSVPCIVAQEGIAGVLETMLEENERKALAHSAAVLQRSIKVLGIR